MLFGVSQGQVSHWVSGLTPLVNAALALAFFERRPMQGGMSSSNQTPGSLPRRAFFRLLGAVTGIGVLNGYAANGSHAAASDPEVIEQKLGEGSCGPCALSNALLNGDAECRRAFGKLPGATSAQRVDALIAQYGSKPSETYGRGRGRFVTGLGLTNEDMPFLANDFLAGAGLPKVRGDWLDQTPGEDERAHLRRVHGLFTTALARGLPPVMEVRAFCADPAGAPKAPWINLYAHWLTLLSVEPPELPSKASGFFCRFADSFTGRAVSAFAYAERFRPFRATRGFSMNRDGTKDWHWLEGHPYVLLNLPDVPLNVEGRPWHERVVVALTYMVHRG